MKMYAVHPGWVVSRNDGDRHYISLAQLLKLYDLERERNWIEWNEDHPYTFAGRNPAHFVHLYPDPSGRYEKPPLGFGVSEEKSLKDLTLTNDVFNMIWTAGLQSGLNLAEEIKEGLLSSQYEVQKRADELINEDADSLEELIRLRKDFGRMG